MIMTRSPLRISLGGGGTDLPSYYQEHSGFLMAAAIDKYVYILMLHRRFVPRILLKYSHMEEVDRIDEIKHPLIRESLRMLEWEDDRLEITSMADIPAGTGLGSSGSFTTALLKALHVQKKNPDRSRELAEQACKIEIDILKEPVGKQDQYIAAYGGITCFRFLPNGKVDAWPLKVSQNTIFDLEDHLLDVLHGNTRSAGEILKDQDVKSKKNDARHGRQSPFHQAARPRHQGCTGGRRPERVWRTDEHALGVQEGTFIDNEQRPDQPLVRSGDAKWGARR